MGKVVGEPATEAALRFVMGGGCEDPIQASASSLWQGHTAYAGSANTSSTVISLFRVLLTVQIDFACFTRSCAIA